MRPWSRAGARFAGAESGYIYSRLGNPTVGVVEAKLAELEGGEDALATASGMGAISTAFWSSVEAGDEIVACDTLYGCTYALLNHGICKFGVTVKFIDMTDLEALKAALSDKTKVVYLETPCNPTLKIVDIAAVSEIAHAYNQNIKVIVDNTFCTPYLQRPLELGADVVVHSATKYLNGPRRCHRGRHRGQQGLHRYLRHVRTEGYDRRGDESLQRVPDGRGLKTLDIRMERHCANARKVADFLVNHPAVDKVYYPGLESFPGHEIAAKQMKLPGGHDLRGAQGRPRRCRRCAQQAGAVRHCRLPG